MIVTITILITKSIQEAERVKERVLPQKGIHHWTSAWPAISMIFKDKQNRDHYHMACSKTESACQGGSCGSTSPSPAQKQWKTETKQHLENYFFHIRSCGAEMLTGGGRGTGAGSLSVSPQLQQQQCGRRGSLPAAVVAGAEWQPAAPAWWPRWLNKLWWQFYPGAQWLCRPNSGLAHTCCTPWLKMMLLWIGPGDKISF